MGGFLKKFHLFHMGISPDILSNMIDLDQSEKGWDLITIWINFYSKQILLRRIWIGFGMLDPRLDLSYASFLDQLRPLCTTEAM